MEHVLWTSLCHACPISRGGRDANCEERAKLAKGCHIFEGVKRVPYLRPPSAVFHLCEGVDKSPRAWICAISFLPFLPKTAYHDCLFRACTMIIRDVRVDP